MIQLRLHIPSPCERLRDSGTETENPPWKVHLLSLVQDVPKAVPVNYENTNQFVNDHDPLSRGSTSSSISLCLSGKTNLTEVHSAGQVIDQTGQPRIGSLRIDIGDLSVPENLEKLCDHIFKLEASKLKARKLESISSRGDISNLGSHENLAYSMPSITAGSLSTNENSGSQAISIPGFGEVFHGLLNKSQTERLLKKDGEFLIRQIIQDDGLILSFCFDTEIRNYRISCDIEEESQIFYLEDRKKGYRDLIELVQDGLTTLYLDMKAGFYVDIMTEMAHINKHDSLLSPSISASRKNSAIPFSRQVSQIQQDRMSKVLSEFGRESFEKIMEIELKQHCFIPGTSNKKSKCQFCKTGSFRPPLKALVCRDCSITIHESCLDKVDSDCEPDFSKISPIFGTDLTTIFKASGKMSCPFILEKCVTEIEQRGFESEGIYRISGYQELILQLQNSLEKEREKADLKSCSDINSICGVIKLFLRQLPEPLITKEVFELFLSEEGPITLKMVKQNIKALPAAHRITLKYLMEHLHRVAESHLINKMGSFNLSSVLTPSIIIPEKMSLNTLKLGTDVVEILIKNVHTLFA